LIDVEVEAEAWTDALPDAEGLVRAAAAAALRSFRAPQSAGEERSVTILLTDDESVRELNARFRDKDAATNVLSFPAPENPEDHLGDVALAFGVCAREAAEQGKPLPHHLQHLTVHGVLHLLGHDHMRDDEAEAMEGLERAVLAGLGVPDPYAAGEGEHDRP
jgi:probable rRNA maturation factor